MTRSTGWILAVAAVLLLGCVGPFADTVDEALQDTPGDYDECCTGAGKDTLAAITGVPVVGGGAAIGGIRVDGVAVTKQLDDRDVDWDKDGDGLLPAGDTHEYVLALITREAPKVFAGIVVTVAPPGAAADPVRFESVPLADSQDGSPIDASIIAIRVPLDHQVTLTVDDVPGAVDLRTGRRAEG